MLNYKRVLGTLHIFRIVKVTIVRNPGALHALQFTPMKLGLWMLIPFKHGILLLFIHSRLVFMRSNPPRCSDMVDAGCQASFFKWLSQP